MIGPQSLLQLQGLVEAPDKGNRWWFIASDRARKIDPPQEDHCSVCVGAHVCVCVHVSVCVEIASFPGPSHAQEGLGTRLV